MRIITLSAMTLALVAASTAAVAAQSSGHFYTHTISTTRTTLPNGNTAILSHYYILNASDKANDPMSHLAGNCSGQSIVSRDGKLLAASGVCFSEDDNGNSLAHWWKMGEAGTADCPNVCGSFGFLPGTGKFKGVTGGGTFKRTHVFSEGSSGSFRETYKMP